MTCYIWLLLLLAASTTEIHVKHKLCESFKSERSIKKVCLDILLIRLSFTMAEIHFSLGSVKTSCYFVSFIKK